MTGFMKGKNGSEGDELRKRKSSIQVIGIIEQNESEIPGKSVQDKSIRTFRFPELKFRD
jgi:hypothetical protein